MKKQTIILRKDTIAPTHRKEHAQYEYYRYPVINGTEGNASHVFFYEVPPKKSAFPKHYHLQTEETFYIISGKGLLTLEAEERIVGAGDIMHFPAGVGGTHKLTNVDEHEMLVYLDFAAFHSPEVTFYPDTNKVGVAHSKGQSFFYEADAVPYYDGEDEQ